MIIDAYIKPNSTKGPLVETGEDGVLVVFVRAPAVEGKANKAAIEALAAHFGVRRGAVSLLKGATSRRKRFVIDVPGHR
ncbi:DUF167 domain-containing protein [Lolliginicoccus suaedae]|uniref:DUF167 domain-containing protein n=1 Tax=Lolliginicoccus suaedae TaxID=2605429 RepID=UPI0011ECB3F4|nr:DUF167 domain-containing protein [Lolliginicoccus suaedae]